MEKTKITYVKGDATSPIGDGKKFIVHVCNNIGSWGAGFVMALSSKWSEPEKIYRYNSSMKLGTITVVPVEDDLYVVNLIGQEGVVYRGNPHDMLPPVRYVAIEKGLERLATAIKISGGSVHMPMIGSGLAGGTWAIIERIIEVTLCEKGIPVTVYQFEE